ncbi:hypothetical protein K1719_013906 [Acacia pycnantha]|nr:hypothetical protein K1719_013906 [Acacia pycnantha]
MASSSSRRYPIFIETLDEVTANSNLFMKTLANLHKYMNTQFKIPRVAKQDLDLHRLFLEVTSLGGIEKVRSERRWTEIANRLEFPTTATKAPSKLEEHYSSYLYHYEQIFYFKAVEWNPYDVAQNPLPIPVPDTNVQQLLPEASSVGTAVSGWIDGKFESGYLVSVTVGSENLRGVLYHDPQNPALPTLPQQGSVPVNNESCSGGSDPEDDKGTEQNMDDASAGMRGVGAENLPKEKEGNDDGDQHAQKMDES